MHPIEQLRYVARASGADATLLVDEAASALAIFRSDPAALLIACKRLLSRQSTVGPLWWLATELVTSADPGAAARRVSETLQADRTPKELAAALRDEAAVAIAGWPSQAVQGLASRPDVRVVVLDIEGQGPAVVRRLERSGIEVEDVEGGKVAGVVEGADVVIVEAGVAGTGAALVDLGSVGLAATAKALSKPVWLLCGAGRRVGEGYWNRMVEQACDQDLLPWLQPFEILSYGLVDRVVTGTGSYAIADWPADRLDVAPELLGPLG